MQLSPDDRLAITDVIAMHGHLFDEGELDRLDQLFTADVVYDTSDFGQDVMHGIDSMRSSALALGDRNPVVHLVTNIVITPIDEGTASVRSKGLGVTVDGKIGSVTYVDTIARTTAGWRIKHRVVQARRRSRSPSKSNGLIAARLTRAAHAPPITS